MATIKICTSIEQSQKLIELGIDINTADMSWLSWMKDGKPGIGFNSELFNNLYDISDFRHEYMPAWSLSALLKLIPNFNMFKRTIECKIETTNHLIDKVCEPLDAAFEMVVWLKENNKI